MLIKRYREPPTFNNDNLHRIAISNLSDNERKIARWWSKKYSQPLKSFEEHTIEELVVEMLEDYYEEKPQEIERFLSHDAGIQDWDGTMSEEYERKMKKRLAKKPQVDLSKFQDEKELTEEEEAAILDNLGRNLPGSSGPKPKEEKVEQSLEFEDTF